MGSIVDKWTSPDPTTGKRVKTERWGRGRRWLARWVDAAGQRHSQACASKDEANALLASIDVRKRAGQYVSPTAGAVTVRDYAEKWRADQLQHRPSTAATTRSRLEKHVYPRLGHLRMADVSRAHLQAFVADVGQVCAPNTTRAVYKLVASLLRAAVDDRIIGHSPAVRVHLPQAPRHRVIPLTLEQVHAIRAGVPGRWRAMVDLAAGTGMRSAELRGLTWDRLNGDRLLVDRQLAAVAPGGVPVFGPPKSAASSRRLRLTPATVAALHEHRQAYGVGKDGLVFASGTGGAFSRSRAQEAWRSTGVEGLRERSGWHDLRHFHASVLISAGLSVRVVADRLGHDDPNVTLRTYSHMLPTDESRALAAITEALTPTGPTPTAPESPEAPAANVVSLREWRAS